RAVDAGLGQLFQLLERERFLENAVVVLTADHGEGFWDHGTVGHGSSLFDELIHVPLIMLVPGNDTHVDVDEVVSLVDVAPTVLDLAEIARPASFEGRSMRALMVAPSWRNLFGLIRRLRTRSWSGTAYSDMALNEESARKLVAATRGPQHLRAVVVGPAKLITTLGGDVQYYDLARDPHEKGTAALP